MSLLQIILKSLRQHLLSTVVAALSIALAGGLLITVWAVKDQAVQAFTQTDSGFDAVLGARGSKLQLVLNAVFHLEASPGNLSMDDYNSVRRHPSVRSAVPIAVGDSFRGFRVVGVTTNLFTDTEFAPGRKFSIDPNGRMFDIKRREAVVGSFAAAKLGLSVGDTFQPAHGFVEDDDHRHEETYVVVGVLEPSNTPVDRVVWIPLAGLQRMSGHRAEAVDEISAVLLQLRSPEAGFRLSNVYNDTGSRLTLAWPIDRIMADLFGKIAWFDRILELVAVLVAIVAIGSVLTSIYNSMNARRRDIAILRALGAHRRTVFSVVVLEAAVIATIGMIGAFLAHFVLMNTAATVIRAETGVVLDPFAFHPGMVVVPFTLIGLSALAGFVPANKAYNVNVARHLTPIS